VQVKDTDEVREVNADDLDIAGFDSANEAAPVHGQLALEGLVHADGVADLKLVLQLLVELLVELVDQLAVSLLHWDVVL